MRRLFLLLCLTGCATASTGSAKPSDDDYERGLFKDGLSFKTQISMPQLSGSSVAPRMDLKQKALKVLQGMPYKEVTPNTFQTDWFIGADGHKTMVNVYIDTNDIDVHVFKETPKGIREIKQDSINLKNKMK